MILEVPFKSQWDKEGNLTSDDCGPACVSMILNFFGEKTTINDVFQKTGAGVNKLITISQLQKAISSYGYTSDFEIGKTWDDCQNLLNQDLPVILLIHYGPLSSRQDKGYLGGHFVVLTGEDNDCWLVNDPDFFSPHRQDGEQHRYKKSEMELAWAQCVKDGNPPYSFLVINKKPSQQTIGDILKKYNYPENPPVETVELILEKFTMWRDKLQKKELLTKEEVEEITKADKTNFAIADNNRKQVSKLLLTDEEAGFDLIIKEIQKLIDNVDENRKAEKVAKFWFDFFNKELESAFVYPAGLQDLYEKSLELLGKWKVAYLEQQKNEVDKKVERIVNGKVKNPIKGIWRRILAIFSKGGE